MSPAYASVAHRPHGLLPVPAEVEDFVARERARLDAYMTDEALSRIRNDLTLLHYYEGVEIAYRVTSSGVEVLAAGWDEVKKYLGSTPCDQRKGVVIGQP